MDTKRPLLIRSLIVGTRRPYPRMTSRDGGARGLWKRPGPAQRPSRRTILNRAPSPELFMQVDGATSLHGHARRALQASSGRAIPVSRSAAERMAPRRRSPVGADVRIIAPALRGEPSSRLVPPPVIPRRYSRACTSTSRILVHRRALSQRSLSRSASPSSSYNSRTGVDSGVPKNVHKLNR
jgi:hypothetical protein